MWTRASQREIAADDRTERSAARAKAPTFLASFDSEQL